MKRLLFVLVVLLVLLIGGALAYALRHPEIAPVDRPDPLSFDTDLIERGEMLAGIGNCRVCHTRVGGQRLAGGLALPTPFGVIHSTNITPDVETGIGAWSEEAFIRAMRHGVDREGNHLYPAFPYDYFTRTTDDDLGAIYAYLMSQEPVTAEAMENGLAFPFDQRLLLAGWKALFLDTYRRPPDPERDEEWNRGAYLVEGLAHCGACHSRRNRFGAASKIGDGAYAGGFAEGWYAPPLTDATPAPVPWTQLALVNYLIDGWDENHGLAAGPMGPVVNDLYHQSEDDVFAIAAYLMTLKGGGLNTEAQGNRAAEARAAAERLEWGHAESPPVPDDPLLAEGAGVFERECVRCHKAGEEVVPLALSTAVHMPTAANTVRVVLSGIAATLGSRGRSMPDRALQVSDHEMAALAAFVRARFSDGPAWLDIEEAIEEARQSDH